MNDIHLRFGDDHYVLDSGQIREFNQLVAERGFERPNPKAAERVARSVADPTTRAECDYAGCEP